MIWPNIQWYNMLHIIMNVWPINISINPSMGELHIENIILCWLNWTNWAVRVFRLFEWCVNVCVCVCVCALWITYTQSESVMTVEYEHEWKWIFMPIYPNCICTGLRAGRYFIISINCIFRRKPAENNSIGTAWVCVHVCLCACGIQCCLLFFD